MLRAVTAAVALAVMALMAATASARTITLHLAATPSAKTITLHYFSTPASLQFLDGAGHPANPNNPPAAGYVLDINDRDYVGNHTHHAKRWTATDHLRCVFQSANSATCDGQIAIGGSMLLANGIHPNLNANPATYILNAGTGVFFGAHGTLTTVAVPPSNSSSDFTIKVSV